VRLGNKSLICDGTWNGISGETFPARPGFTPGQGRHSETEKEQMSPRKIAAVATAAACMTLFSFGWSEQHGVSLSIASAQAARVSHAFTESQHARHAAARSHRAYRPVARGYGPNPVAAGAGLAAGAVNTAGAVAAGAIGTAGAIAAAPFGGPGPYAATPGWGPGGPYYAAGYTTGPGWGGGYYSPSTWGDHDCSPGYGGCRSYGEKDWYGR
jgi:hypothetical protein